MYRAVCPKLQCNVHKNQHGSWVDDGETRALMQSSVTDVLSGSSDFPGAVGELQGAL